MKGRAAILSLLGLGTLLVLGVARVYSLRLSGGDIFPVYSSLRADPLGTRAIYEALAAQPDLAVERSLKPYTQLDASRRVTLLLPGMTRGEWAGLTREEAGALDRLARAGSRVVVLFAAELEPTSVTTPASSPGAKPKQSTEEQIKRKQTQPDRLKPAEWSNLWQIEVKRRRIVDLERGALREPDAPLDLPESLPWKSDLFFSASSSNGWKTLYLRGRSPVFVERSLGRGSLVFATDTFFLSNEALRDHRQLTLLTWLVGAHRQVVFSEHHLGVEENPGIAALGRRYGLTGAFVSALVLAGLFVWRQAARFVPPPPPPDETPLDYSPTAGIEAVLRRSVEPQRLVSTCLEEWGRGASPPDVAKARSALALLPAAPSPADAYNAVVRVLRRR